MKTIIKKAHAIKKEQKIYIAGTLCIIREIKEVEDREGYLQLKFIFEPINDRVTPVEQFLRISPLFDFEIILEDDEFDCECKIVETDGQKTKIPCETHYVDYTDL